MLWRDCSLHSGILLRCRPAAAAEPSAACCLTYAITLGRCRLLTLICIVASQYLLAFEVSLVLRYIYVTYYHRPSYLSYSNVTTLRRPIIVCPMQCIFVLHRQRFCTPWIVSDWDNVQLGFCPRPVFNGFNMSIYNM